MPTLLFFDKQFMEERTMTDELKQQLTERFDKITPSEFTNPTMYDSLLKVYLAGTEHGYQYAVEKACEWMENHADEYCDDIDNVHLSAMIGDLKYVLENGNY